MQPTDIYQFTDYRKWMRAWFNAKRGRPSMRRFATLAECSASMVSSAVSGSRDLPLPIAEKLCELAKLGPDERAYFQDLYEVEHGASLERRRAARERVRGARHFHDAQQDVDPTSPLLGRWYVLAIVELARCKGFRPDPAWIAGTLRPTISEAEAAAALDALLEAGVLKRGDDGNVKPAASIWASDREVGRPSAALVAALHREMLARAAGALELFSRDERHLVTVSLSVPASAIPELKAEVGRFMEQVTGRYDEAEPREQVLQLSIQLVPLSARTT